MSALSNCELAEGVSAGFHDHERVNVFKIPCICGIYNWVVELLYRLLHHDFCVKGKCLLSPYCKMFLKVNFFFFFFFLS